MNLGLLDYLRLPERGGGGNNVPYNIIVRRRFIKEMVKKRKKRLRPKRKNATIAEGKNGSPTLRLEDVFYGLGSM